MLLDLKRNTVPLLDSTNYDHESIPSRILLLVSALYITDEKKIKSRKKCNNPAAISDMLMGYLHSYIFKFPYTTQRKASNRKCLEVPCKSIQWFSFTISATGYDNVKWIPLQLRYNFCLTTFRTPITFHDILPLIKVSLYLKYVQLLQIIDNYITLLKCRMFL